MVTPEPPSKVKKLTKKRKKLIAKERE